LFNGNKTTDEVRFPEGTYVDIDLSTIGVTLDYKAKVKVYWYHSPHNISWGAFITLMNGTSNVAQANDGPFSNEVERSFTATVGQSQFVNKIRVGARDTGQPGYDARIREIEIFKSNGTKLSIYIP